MSVAESTLKQTKQQVDLPENFKLIIEDSVVSQVDHLHNAIGNVEWSGVLVYNAEGSINDMEGLTLTVKDIIFMDIGTGAATEYSFESDDKYLMEGMGKVVDNGYKMGHIHTHHNLGVYFSGVDIDELHLNAANHNYYLSLIVGMGGTPTWKAKIAYCGNKTTTGTATVTGSKNVVTTWRSETQLETNEETEDLSDVTDLALTEELLFTVDAVIEFPSLEELSARIEELKAKKIAAKSNYYRQNTPGYVKNAKGTWVQKKGPTTLYNYRTEPSTPITLFPSKVPVREPIQGTSVTTLNTVDNVDPDEVDTIVEGFFDMGKARLFLGFLLAPKKGNNLYGVKKSLKLLDGYNDKQTETFLTDLADTVENKAEKHFCATIDAEDMHMLSVSCIYVLQPFIQTSPMSSSIIAIFRTMLFPKFVIDLEDTTRIATSLPGYKQN